MSLSCPFIFRAGTRGCGGWFLLCCDLRCSKTDWKCSLATETCTQWRGTHQIHLWVPAYVFMHVFMLSVWFFNGGLGVKKLNSNLWVTWKMGCKSDVEKKYNSATIRFILLRKLQILYEEVFCGENSIHHALYTSSGYVSTLSVNFPHGMPLKDFRLCYTTRYNQNLRASVWPKELQAQCESKLNKKMKIMSRNRDILEISELKVCWATFTSSPLFYLFFFFPLVPPNPNLRSIVAS